MNDQEKAVALRAALALGEIDRRLAAAVVALQQIARAPVGAWKSREIARRTLIEIGSDWTKRGTETEPPG
jgi:hypothetical protein